ncbi:opine metallophore biosynthesis dehydrogenase [Paenibacillus humicus]|uniref:opine metallophore biosynthesis dehydrogenase n=1 Tax=Paenibacillus humicus TaxID=412861 RepID=UPI003F1621BB
MSALGDSLILGTGPAAVQLAVLLRRQLSIRVGIAGRSSPRSRSFFAALAQGDGALVADVQNAAHRELGGTCMLDAWHEGYDRIEGEWPTLVLAVTADAYVPVLEQLPPSVLKAARCLVLVSPTFGSGSLVGQLLQRLQPAARPEVVSFSTYLGDTRWPDGRPGSRAVTTGVKRKVFIGSSCGRSSAVMEELQGACARSGIAMEALESPLAAETRNISLYVHPPLFMNEFALEAVFSLESDRVQTYVYKLYPEGPITPSLIRDMRSCWLEISAIVQAIGLRPINLLRFMTEECYPVRPQSLSSEELERFPELDAVHQQYLLYIRYASLLIDPFSEPDGQGRYFDFSAVPIRSLAVNDEGRWEVPRMPKEDYYRTATLQGIARRLGVPTPTIDRLLGLYESRLAQARAQLAAQALSEAFYPGGHEAELELIVRGLPDGSRLFFDPISGASAPIQEEEIH